jgi:hypothetical protein
VVDAWWSSIRFASDKKQPLDTHTQKDGHETDRFFGLRDRPTSFLPTSVGPPEWYSLLEISQHAGLSLRRPRMHVRFVVDKEALGQDFYPSTSVFTSQQFH